MWILGSAKRELSAFYSLPLLIILTYPWWDNRPLQTMLILFVTIGIDTSHVYATAFRTWFNRDEMRRAKIFHLGVPFLILTILFLWCALGIPGLWSFVLYLTVFHHIRQYYGIHRWSLSLNRPKGPSCEKELYALTILPFVGYHFRGDIDYQGFFSREDMFRYPSELGFNIVVILIVLTSLSFLFKIYKSYSDKSLALPVLTTVIFPSVISIFCFMISNNFFLSLLPILAIHGATYYHVTGLAQAKIYKGFWAAHPKISLALICLFAIFMGGLESWLTDSEIDILPSLEYKGNYLLAFGVAFVTTPAIYHYIADAFVWKKSHPDFIKVISP